MITVIYIPNHQKPSAEYPLALLHKGQITNGHTIQSSIDDWSTKHLGMTAANFLNQSRNAPQRYNSRSMSQQPTRGNSTREESNSTDVILTGMEATAEIVTAAADSKSSGIDLGDLADGASDLLQGLGDVLGGVFDAF